MKKLIPALIVAAAVALTAGAAPAGPPPARVCDQHAGDGRCLPTPHPAPPTYAG